MGMSSATLKWSAQSHSSAVEFIVLLRSHGKWQYRTKPHYAAPQVQLQVFHHLLRRRSPIATWLLCVAYICVLAVTVLMIKMACIVNRIILRRDAQSQLHSRSNLAGSRGKTVSRYLELSPDALDDHGLWWHCHALDSSQDAAASPFGPLNQSYGSFAPAAKADFTQLEQANLDMQFLYSALPTPKWIAGQCLCAPCTLDIAT